VEFPDGWRRPGSERFDFRLARNRGFTTSGWPFASPVVGEDGTIYQTLVYDSWLFAIEPEGGTILWSTDLAEPDSVWFERFAGEPDSASARCGLGDSCWSEPALGPDGTIYVSLNDPFLRAVNPNGSIKWVARLGMIGGFTLTVGSDGLIYAAGDDRSLYAVGADGKEVSRFGTNDRLNFPVVSADGTVLVSGGRDTTLLVSRKDNTVWAIARDGCGDKRSDLYRAADVDGSRVVDLLDVALLAVDWLGCTNGLVDPWCVYESDVLYLTGDVDRDLYVDFADFAAIANQWLSED